MGLLAPVRVLTSGEIGFLTGLATTHIVAEKNEDHSQVPGSAQVT